jgi:hypothetical protein
MSEQNKYEMPLLVENAEEEQPVRPSVLTLAEVAILQASKVPAEQLPLFR